jgi:hypothetical protein
MKTKIEFGDYTVEIEELEGVLTVKAEKEGEEETEVVEEFSLQLEDGEGAEAPESDDDEDVKNFGDFAQEEDFDSEELEMDGEFEGDEDLDKEEDEDNDETQLESFNSFISKIK